MPSVPIGYDGSGGIGGAFYANYKQIYSPKNVEPLVYKNRPFLRDIRKTDDFEGTNIAHSIFYEDPQGGSQTYGTALAQEASSSQSARLTIWRSREYQNILLDNEEIRASRSNLGALVQKKAYESRRVLEEMARRIDIACHGGGSGVIGSFSTGTTITGNTLTLDTPFMCVRFSRGQFLQVSSNSPADGTVPALMNGGAVAQVVSVNRSTQPSNPSTITLNTSLSSLGLATSTQYFLLRNGDGLGFGQNVIKGGTCGLKAWLPSPPPVGSSASTPRLAAGDSFWGFNRNVDVQRLAGCSYVPQSGEKYQVTLQNAAVELENNGGGNDMGKMVCYVNPVDWTGYSLELGPQVRYQSDDEGYTGFKRLVVSSAAGELLLTADPQVDPGLFYILDRDTYRLASLDAVPHLDESDGNMALRSSGGQDAQEIRWRAWYQPIFDEPGRNLVGRFA